MTVGVVNNWPNLGVTGRVDVDTLTVGGSPVTASNGTVTSMSVVTANGVSGSVATATTTPAVTLTLGAITPTSVAASGAITALSVAGTTTLLASAAPASAGAAGVTGTITWDAGFVYICVATNTWVRAAIATWP